MILSTRNVNFGSAKTGLATVGYRLLNADGTTQLTRTTTGVSEILAGTGIYQAEVSFPENWSGTLLWDTGEATPRYASDAFDVRSVDSSTRFPAVAPGGVEREKQTWSKKDKRELMEIVTRLMDILGELKGLHQEHSTILAQLVKNSVTRVEVIPMVEGLSNSIKSLQQNHQELIQTIEVVAESQVVILESQEVHETIEEEGNV